MELNDVKKPADAKSAFARNVRLGLIGAASIACMAGTSALSYMSLPATASVITKGGSAMLVGGTTMTAGLAVGAAFGAGGYVAGSLVSKIGLVLGMSSIIGTKNEKEKAFRLLDAYMLFPIAAAGVCAVAGVVGTYSKVQGFFHDILDENKPQTSSMNVEFSQSATPYFKEIQAKLKVEKGLVLDIAPKANTQKLSLA